jgi:8-oxo-dGTP pyrophosphatase MutT (NUDIX family)
MNKFHLPKLNKINTLTSGKFRRFASNEYILPDGTIKTCETLNTSNNAKYAHGIGAIPIIKQTKQIILIENFRYPINKKCIEFPSGLYEDNELKYSSNEEINKIAIEAIKRELKEETGYYGEFVNFFTLPENDTFAGKFFGDVYADPWKSNDSTVMALFFIDLEKNKEHKQQLEDSEFIKVYLVEMENFLDFLCQKAKEGYAIRKNLYSLAIGLKFDEFSDFTFE